MASFLAGALAALMADSVQAQLAAVPFDTAAISPQSPPIERLGEFPTVLSPADISTYREAFRLQEAGAFAAADRALVKVKDRLLVGHVLAQRYLHPAHRSSFAELQAWLKAYADHPDAPAIYGLASRRAPKSAPPLVQPKSEDPSAIWIPDDGWEASADSPSSVERFASEPNAKSPTASQIRAKLRAGELIHAEKLIRSRAAQREMNEVQIDRLKARLAAGWFAAGSDDKAYELAGEAASRNGAAAPRANWIAGLANYRMGRHAKAALYFEDMARTPEGSAWDISAGAFWAARAHLQARRFELVNYWTALAAEHPGTFYGIMALRSMLNQVRFTWEPPPLREIDAQSIARAGAGRRAFALIEIGQEVRAEEELRRLAGNRAVGLTRALLAVAARAGMPQLAMRLAAELSDLEGKRNEGALWPLPRWRPLNGWEVDRALIYAFMRQESGFNPRAVSPAGARGLMQLMPGTAASMNGGKGKPSAGQLYDPVFNLTLGQKYIRHLLESEPVEGDLVRLAAAYNGGPGNLAKWKRKQDMRGDPGDDALLFIESLPMPETRQFIARVLYNYWMYSLRLGQPTPSLDAIAAGEWPTYTPTDRAIAQARNAKN